MVSGELLDPESRFPLLANSVRSGTPASSTPLGFVLVPIDSPLVRPLVVVITAVKTAQACYGDEIEVLPDWRVRTGEAKKARLFGPRFALKFYFMYLE